MKLRTILTIFVSFLVIIAVGISTYVVLNRAYQFSTDQLVEAKSRNFKIVQDRLLAEVNSLVDDVRRDSHNFSIRKLFSFYFNEGDLDSFLATFDNERNSISKKYDFIAATDDKLKVFFSSRKLDNEILSPFLLSSPTLTFVEVANEIYIVKSAPVKGVRGPLGWLLYGKKLSSIINSSLENEIGMSIVLYDQNKRVLAASNPILGANQRLKISPGTLNTCTQDGKEFVYAAVTLGQDKANTLFIVLATPTDAAFVTYESLVGRLTVFLTIFVSIAIAFTFYISKTITGPIALLIRAAGKIRNGIQARIFPKGGSTEVVELADAIKDMQTGIREREDMIHQLAYFDKTTGLPNRNKFLEMLEKWSLTEIPDFIVATVDINRFKEINGVIGHRLGDDLLTMIASRMGTLNKEIFFVARIGGDEFGVLAETQNNHSVEDNVEIIRTLFDPPFVLGELKIDINVSIGVAHFPRATNDFNAILRCSEQALDACKTVHTETYIYSEKINNQTVQHLNLMSELKDALKSEQVSLYYQPKLNLTSNEYDSVECLIRWKHPTHGFMPPDKFIPLAEQTGVIREVTKWAVNVAIHQHCDWRYSGRLIGVAVNISTFDLVDNTLPIFVDDLLKRFGMDPKYLTIEVTETSVMQDSVTAYSALQSLAQLGITISIDDFGTGYSSLSQLKKMPFDELKIDRSFVKDLVSEREDSEFVTTIVALGKSLGLTVVAEGVEDEETLNWLKVAGADKAQGFYMSKPLSLGEFNDFIDLKQRLSDW